MIKTAILCAASLIVFCALQAEAQQKSKQDPWANWTWQACYKRQLGQGKTQAAAKAWCDEGARRKRLGIPPS
jgi:hypothetical protein